MNPFNAHAAAPLIVALCVPLSDTARAQEPGDREAIVELANAIDNAVDAKDWERARTYFTGDITVDLPGQEPALMPADDLVGSWATNLHAGKPSFHLRGSHAVTFGGPHTATIVSKAYAWNLVEGIPGGDLYEVWGDYTYEVVRDGDGWRVSSFAFEPVHQRGNMRVPAHRPGD